MDYAHYSAVRRDEQVLSARGAEYLFFFQRCCLFWLVVIEPKAAFTHKVQLWNIDNI